MTTLYAEPDQVTEAGKAQNFVGFLRLPEGDITLRPSGFVLKLFRKGASGMSPVANKFPELAPSAESVEPGGRLPDGQGQMVLAGMVDAGWWKHEGTRMSVCATLDNTPHGVLLHVSLSLPKRDPSWSLIKQVRMAFYPPNVDVMMGLPRLEDYVNVDPHCFQMWQMPEKWGMR